MKKVFEILMAVVVFALAVVIPTELSHLITDPVAGGIALGLVVNFASIDAQCFQAPNPGGVRRLLILCSRFFAAPWPRMASEDGSDIGTLNEDNEITLAPTYDNVAVKWAEIYFPDGTAEINSDGGGDAGYQSYKHMVEVALAGFSKEVRREVRKHLNAGSVFLFEMKDGQYVVAGSSDDPIFVKPSFKGGKKGNDKRGYTLKGEVDGMPFDLPVMPAAMVATLPIAPLVLIPPVEEGGGA